MNRAWASIGVLLSIGLVACGGAKTEGPGPIDTGGGVKWIRGMDATDIKAAAQKRGLRCEGPKLQQGTNVWNCDSATPMVNYHVEFYGAAPARIEYLRSVVSFGGQPREDLTRAFLADVAALKYQGAEPEKARQWVEKTLPATGESMFGPIKYKLLGDAKRQMLDIKAPGSDW